MSKNLIAGNWKMNGSIDFANSFFQKLIDQTHNANSEILVCLPHVLLSTGLELTANTHVKIGAQDCSKFSGYGAYTGEISANMLRDLGCHYAVIGHSERREYFSETNEVVAEKIAKLNDADITPIVCVGESLEHRKSEQHFDVIASQVDSILASVDGNKDFVIAYEPIWAIGTGETATPEEANSMHQFIHDMIGRKFSSDYANTKRVLYGGSMNAQNAKDLLAQEFIAGGLIGGASLKHEDFSLIANI